MAFARPNHFHQFVGDVGGLKVSEKSEYGVSLDFAVREFGFADPRDKCRINLHFSFNL